MTIRNEARVTPSESVDGTKRRRSPQGRRKLAETTRNERASEALMTAARAALRPGEKLVVVSASEVHLVPM